MAVNLTGKSLISLKDYSYDEIRYLMDTAHTVKAERKSNNRKTEIYRNEPCPSL